MRSNTGAIVKNVRNIASPMSIWLVGVCAVPSAWRRIASTMMMRVKEVIMMSPAGSSVNALISSRIWRLRL